MPNGKEKNSKRGGKRFHYNTHGEGWGCVYDHDSNDEAVVMVNEFNQPGLTRKLADMFNAGTL